MYQITTLLTSFNPNHLENSITNTVTWAIRVSTYKFEEVTQFTSKQYASSCPKFMSLSCAKYICSVHIAPKALIHSSINSKVQSLI